MPETSAVQEDRTTDRAPSPGWASRQNSYLSLHELWFAGLRNLRLFLSIMGAFLGVCLLYCLIASNVYEAVARVALRGAPVSVLTLDRGESTSGSFASGQVQLETLANVFRSDQLAWDVITRLSLYKTPGFMDSFSRKFPTFDPAQPSPDAKAWLLEKFQRDLTVQTIPRTLVLQIRFRSYDPALSAAIANAIIATYKRQDANARVEATTDATTWLNTQLGQLKLRADGDDRKLAEFQKQHGILDTPETLGNGRPSDVEHTTQLEEVDGFSRELVNAATDRILREAEYRAAISGDPELVLASDPKLQGTAGFALLLQQLHARRSDLEQEQAQLRIEHGPNFPRVVEIRSQMQDLDAQIKTEDIKLVERFRSAWKTAADREQLVRKSLSAATGAGLEVNEAGLKYAVMRQEANANRDVYLRVSQQVEEASLTAGSYGSELSVVDYARQPVKPVSPNLPVYMAITLFVSLWLAMAAVLIRESIHSKAASVSVLLVFLLAMGAVSRAQAPTPSTSGLPTGVARIPQSVEAKSQPNAKDAPAVWETLPGANLAGVPPGAAAPAGALMAAPIGPGDLLEVSEARTPEIRASVRVSESGAVTLTLAGEVNVRGMDETAAAHAINAALIERGMLLHPQVTVLVMAYAGQDVSVLGEVARPGIYSYTVHHRLLDLISSASGLGPNAGRLVTIGHRDDPKTVHPVVLDPAGTDTTTDHNPELLPGDTVQVSRAGLVYVVGDVIRPGGFPVDPSQTATLVQVLSLAWGPGQNAALTKAILIREQGGSRTVTTLNLKRMLRGLDPDIPIRDRDIVFVPDSMAKNLWNRTMESVIQSAAGVSIYAGLVYSQRF